MLERYAQIKEQKGETSAAEQARALIQEHGDELLPRAGRRRLLRIAAQRLVHEARFFGNTIIEAVMHPRSTSYIDKRSGKVVGRELNNERKKL